MNADEWWNAAQAARYRDRCEAGQALLPGLERYRGRRPLVIGIPRGGVPVAAEVARGLEADLDVVVARKLGAPGQPELAIGAVTADGGRFLNAGMVRTLNVSQEYLEVETAREMAEARRRETWLRRSRPAIPVRDRVVILVDDGLATGATVRAALRSVRKGGPALLVVAAPVGSIEACEILRSESDDVVCPSQPEPFGAIGFYYQHFEPVEDQRVRQILEAFQPVGLAGHQARAGASSAGAE